MGRLSKRKAANKKNTPFKKGNEVWQERFANLEGVVSRQQVQNEIDIPETIPEISIENDERLLRNITKRKPKVSLLVA